MPHTALPRALRLKLASVIACAAAGVALIAFVAVHFPAAQLAALEASLVDRAGADARMISALAQPAVAFDDRATARELFDSVATDPAVTRLALYDHRGGLIHSLGEGRDLRPLDPDATVVRRGRRAITVTTPVLSPEGPRGVLVVDLSRAEVLAQRRSVHLTAALVALLALLIGASSAWSAGTAMHLARTIARQSEALDERNRATQRLLDNVSQGFVGIDAAGAMAAERSAAFDRWFGAPAAGSSWFDCLARIAPDFAAATAMYWTEVTDAVMPLEVTLAQMPRALAAGGAHYDVAYRAVGEEPVARYLVVVTDVTAEVARQRLEEGHRETMTLFARAVADRSGVAEFFDEGDAILALLGRDDVGLPALKRQLHTLKGNAALIGLTSISAQCHRLEDVIAVTGRRPSPAERDELAREWSRVAGEVERLLGRPAALRLDEDQYASLLAAARADDGSRALVLRLRALRLEPVGPRLEGFAEQARRLAEREEKPDLAVTVVDDGVRLDPRRFRPFWGAFVHAVRNAVDHGVEAPDERVRAGKPAAARLWLRARVEGDRVVIEVEDDGRGVDWNRLRERAICAGLPTATDDDLQRALFADAVSTRSTVSELSGRGVGLGALREAAEALGGDVAVSSSPGRGTTLRVRFPVGLSRPFDSTAPAPD